MKKKLVTMLLALVLAVSMAAPAGAKKEDSVRWLDFELPEAVAEAVREGQAQNFMYYSLLYSEPLGFLTVHANGEDGESRVFDLETGEEADYFDVFPLSDGLFVFNRDGDPSHYGLMDAKERVLIDPVCDRYAVDLGGGLYGMVSESEGEAYLLDDKGKIVETYFFDSSFYFTALPRGEDDKWLALVGSDDSEGFIAAKGHFAVPLSPYFFNIPVNGLIGFMDFTAQGVRYGVMDVEGLTVLAPLFKSLIVGDGGLITAQNEDGLYGVVDREGSVVIPFTYTSLSAVDHGLIAACDGPMDGDNWGVIDIEENTVAPFRYSRTSIAPCGEDVFIRVQDQEAQGLLDREGQELLPLKYDNISPEESDLIMAVRNGKCGLVDKDGDYVFGPVTGEWLFQGGSVVVVLSDFFDYEVSGIFTLDGEELLPLDGRDSARVRMMDGLGIIVDTLDDGERQLALLSEEGEVLLPLTCDVITPQDTDYDGLEDTFLVMDGERVGICSLAAKPAGDEAAEDKAGGFPWVWVAVGVGGAVVLIAVIVVVVVVSKKRKKKAIPAPAAEGPRFCTECGAPLTPGSSFCRNCGKKL